MNYTYKLSICMMVKDEEKNLGKCLGTLSPILEKPDVELIIVDTGSMDNTVDIANKYTSKLYFHQWQGHFSDMRNVTISYAKGEWILILDADEVILDIVKLYNLLTDKNLEKFNTIIVKVKNYTSLGTNPGYTVLPQERVFRNDGSFKYEGSVHNQPKYKAPLYNSDLYIEHFGYLFGIDKELKEKKFKRTAGILMKELEADPNNIYYRYQLARSYNAHSDTEEALCEIRRAHKIISNMDNKTKRVYSFVYPTYAQISCQCKEYTEALNICKEGIDIRNDLIDLYYLCAYAYVSLEMPHDAVEYYLKFVDLAENYHSLPISAERSAEMHYLDKKYQNGALSFISGVYYNKGEYAEAYKYINRMSSMEEKIPTLIKVILKLGRYEELVSIYDEVKEHENLSNAFISILEANKKNLTLKDNLKISKLLSQGSDIYSILNKIRTCDAEERDELAKKAISIADFNDLPDFYSEIFCDFCKNPRQVFLVFKQLKKSKIKEIILFLIDKYEKVREYLVEYLQKENIRENDYSSLKTYISVAGVMLFKEAGQVKNEEREINENIYNIFKFYVERGLKYIDLFYSMEKMRLYYNTIGDDEDRFFAALLYSMKAVSRNDYKAGIKYFKDAVKAYPYMVCFMNKYKDELLGNEDSIKSGMN